jgi:hypothetical protein
MIITDPIQYIPFDHITRKQAAQLLHTSTAVIDRYVTVGKKVNGTYIRLPKRPGGTFSTIDVQAFINRINNKSCK